MLVNSASVSVSVSTSVSVSVSVSVSTSLAQWRTKSSQAISARLARWSEAPECEEEPEERAQEEDEEQEEERKDSSTFCAATSMKSSTNECTSSILSRSYERGKKSSVSRNRRWVSVYLRTCETRTCA